MATAWGYQTWGSNSWGGSQAEAAKAMVEAKRSGNKSNLGTALQIEMALDEAKRFEAELMMLFQGIFNFLMVMKILVLQIITQMV